VRLRRGHGKKVFGGVRPGQRWRARVPATKKTRVGRSGVERVR
jgi:hypothetical protein